MPHIYILSIWFICLSNIGIGQDTHGLFNTKKDTSFNEKDEITGIGSTVAKGKYKGLKFGYWTEYYQTGEKKCSGMYLTEKYMECNDGGIFWKYYSYKVGQWKYYYQNGFIKAEGTFETQVFNYPTTCKGGYNLIKQKVGENWIFYSENEKIMKPEKQTIKLMEDITFKLQ